MSTEKLTQKERTKMTAIAALGALGTTAAMSAAATTAIATLGSLQLTQSINHWGQMTAVAAGLGAVAVGAAHLNQKLGARAIEFAAGDQIWDTLLKTTVGKKLIEFHRKLGPAKTKMGMAAVSGVVGFIALKEGNIVEALTASVVAATPFVLANALNARKKFQIALNQQRAVKAAQANEPLQLRPEILNTKEAFPSIEAKPTEFVDRLQTKREPTFSEEAFSIVPKAPTVRPT